MFATAVRLAPMCVSKPALRREASTPKLAPRRVAALGYPRPSVKARVNLKEDLERVDASETLDALKGDDPEAKFQVAVGVGGLVTSGIMTWSLVTLKDTGCGLPPGPGGVLGALEGVSYLYVVGLIAWSAIKKAKTGSGLPAGPGGILGGAEGIAYLVALGGIVVGIMQATHFGYLPNAIPVEGGPCFSP